MKFRYFEVSHDDESTGDGSRSYFFRTLRDARRFAAKVAEMERKADEEDGIPESPITSGVIQETTLTGTPKEVAAAALIAAGSSNEAEWDGKRGEIHRGRRWNVTSKGKLVLVSESVSD